MLETKSLSTLRLPRVFFDAILLVIAFFMMKLGQFLLLPFLAIYLSQCALSPVSIGTIIAFGQLSYSVISIFTGHLSARYNPRHVFIITLLGSGVAYEAFYQQHSLVCFILLNTLIGAFRAIFDNVSKTLLVIHTTEQQRVIAFGLRYAVLNLAAALGPLLGARYAAEQTTQLFHLIAYGYLFTGFLLFIFYPKQTLGRVDVALRDSKSIPLRLALRLMSAHYSLKVLF